MKQEPVAIYTGNYTIGFLNSDKTLKVGEPLYTAPRQLSDEEINQIAIETDKQEEISNEIWIYIFARAILKKASEK